MPTAGESEWDEQERAWMLALAEYRDLLCPSCGRLASVCQAAENEDRFRTEVVRCHAQTAISRASKQYADSDAPEALMFRAWLPD